MARVNVEGQPYKRRGIPLACLLAVLGVGFFYVYAPTRGFIILFLYLLGAVTAPLVVGVGILIAAYVWNLVGSVNRAQRINEALDELADAS